MPRAIFGTRTIGSSDVVQYAHTPPLPPPPSRGGSVPNQRQILAEVFSEKENTRFVHLATIWSPASDKSVVPNEIAYIQGFPSNRNSKTAASSQYRHSDKCVSNSAYIAFQFHYFPSNSAPPTYPGCTVGGGAIRLYDRAVPGHNLTNP